jgi:hypothetical protein
MATRYACPVRDGLATNWGDVPTWLGATASVGALLAAVAAAIIARRIYTIESERDRRAELDRNERRAAERRAQAEAVGAWADGSDESRTCIWVANGSQLPIWDVVVRVYVPSEPGRELGKLVTMASRQVVPPSGGAVKLATVGPEANESLVEVEFRDASGVPWLRDRFGVLSAKGEAAWTTAQRSFRSAVDILRLAEGRISEMDEDALTAIIDGKSKITLAKLLGRRSS